MHQLAILTAADEGLARRIDAVRGEWAHALGDSDHLAAAALVTAERFADWGTRALDHRETARVTAYFGAVARRRISRGRDCAASAARRRLAAASIEADLVSAGWTAARAVAEARRVTGLECGLGGAA
ncbi:MAG: hypothetical protein EG823_07505 [Actinobacteria bacterium]|nr:hypothetical protein [Actinomycetota bacterium]